MTATVTEFAPSFERDPIRVEIVETGWKPWDTVFHVHHYLADAGRMPFSTAFTAFEVESGDPVAFVGVSGMVVSAGKGKTRRVARACRLVVHPEWQGAGVGLRFLRSIAEREAAGEGFIGHPTPTYIHTAHPALCAALRRDPGWTQVSSRLVGDSMSMASTQLKSKYGGHLRSVAGFRFGK